MYGETVARRSVAGARQGLSPHVRGNRVRETTLRRRDGSIPACTGKPAATASAAAVTRVYPRMYGETPHQLVRRNQHGGLSPHVRGNHFIAFSSTAT